MLKVSLAVLLLAAPGLALAQSASPAGPQASGQSVTQPSPNMNNPQAQMNDNQQPPNASRSGSGQAIGQQLTHPIPSQNQPQTETNDNQQPPNAAKSR